MRDELGVGGAQAGNRKVFRKGKETEAVVAGSKGREIRGSTTPSCDLHTHLACQPGTWSRAQSLPGLPRDS